jgi:hypothetical protein
MSAKIDKQLNAEKKCTACGMDLVCLETEYEGKKTLSWFEKGTTQKHFTFDSDKQESKCRYHTIAVHANLLRDINKLVRHVFNDADNEIIKHYTTLIYNRFKFGGE